MLWYLLSPIRGTAEPPTLSPSSPIRRAFYRHGKTTAQHWLVAMLVSVAIAMGLSYPTIFLPNSPNTGFAAYPQKVWTSAKPVDDGIANVDVEMRQIWVHGSYMNALDKHVLKRALKVQQSLVGDDGGATQIPTVDEELRFGYHSPLMYWNNSAEVIDADVDVLKTINDQKHLSSSLNVILRPASVFAGKKFSRRQLLAADALVITLMNKVGEGVGNEWQHRMRALASGVCENCTLFPRDGHITAQQVYEFTFKPLSIQEHVALTFAYGFMALYVLLSLRRMKAFHSRFGLVVTAITQMTFSILGSFTICGILKINLSMIPQNAYPFVVLVLGAENMFRLINAVLQYPPTMATEMRIANALGDIGPISVAAAAQNLTVLGVLSTVVSPGVAAFTTFAAVATLLDTFFLLTFFLAVLNVDIRRLELQDALVARHNQTRHRRRPSPAQHTWFDALVQGRLPFSTRMAGTTVTATFVLSLNYHFFEPKENIRSFNHLLSLARGGQPSVGDLDTFAPPPMNATLTPGEWIRMQDFDTAKEVMRLAKPGADSFVVRLFAPLVVVFGGSDRTDVSNEGDQWVQALRSFAIHHFYPVAVAIMFAVAFVAVLMNFLLYNEAGDEDNDIALEQLEDTTSVETVGLPHRLDIVKLASSGNGHFGTISLDRTIAISIADRTGRDYHAIPVPLHVLRSISWPVHHFAIDESGEWIACHCANNTVLAYNSATGTLVTTLLQMPDGRPALIFDFFSLPSAGSSKLYFMVLTSGGRLAMNCLEDGTQIVADICINPLVGAALVETITHGRKLFTVTEDAKIMSHGWTGNEWLRKDTAVLERDVSARSSLSFVDLRLYADLDTELLVVTTSESVGFLNASTLAKVNVFFFHDLEGHLESVLLGPSRKCTSCGQLGLRRFAALTSISDKDKGFLTNWLAKDDTDVCICLYRSTAGCASFDDASIEKHAVGLEGVWSISGSQVFGLRSHLPQAARARSELRRPTSAEMRQRRHARKQAQLDESAEHWEAYKLSSDGVLDTVNVPRDLERSLSEEATLYVTQPGPIVPLDSQAVAVAFGNTVKVIRSSRRGSVTRRSASSVERHSSSARRVTARKTR